MSGIFDQVINYAPPSLLKGTVTYKGTWSAATNTPTLINPPDSTTNGHYYVVSAAGTQFSLVFNIGDWIISNGSAWEKVDNTDAVSSVFGRTGAVVGVSTDYSAVGITATAVGASSPSTGAFTTLSSTSTTTLNSTTIPASKTLVVTTDKISVLAATTSAELAGVISDETGSGALVFATLPTFGATGVKLSGSTSGTTTVLSGATAGTSVLTLPVATDTLVGKATTDTLTNKTITGGILNGTLGATTPSTIAATTLTTSSTVTHNGGTANGVAFLNGSKVLTTGSALTFDGTGFSVTGTSSATLKLNGRASDNASSANFYDNTGATRYGFVYFDSTSGGQIATTNANPLAFLINSTEVMRLTSTGLNSTAIGATTPSTVAATTLTTTGNVGINVTSSAWDSTYRAIEIGRVGNTVAGFNGGTEVNIAANAYYNAGWKYAVSTLATRYMTDNTGKHYWYTAPTGTAGNAITFTQAMLLDSTGAAITGTLSTTDTISTTKAVASAGNIVSIKNSTDTGGDNTRYAGVNFLVGSDDGTSSIRSYRTNSATNYETALAFLTNPSGATQTPTEKMRITSTGNVGINETSPTQGKLVISNPSGSTDSGVTGNSLYLKAETVNANLIRLSGAIATDLIIGRFGNADAFSIGTTGGATFATFNSTGLGIGTASPSRKLELSGGSADIRITNTTGIDHDITGSQSVGIFDIDVDANNEASAPAFRVLISGSEKMRVIDGGDVLVSTTSTSLTSGGINLRSNAIASSVLIGHQSGVANGNSYAEFSYAGSLIGSITQSTTSAVLFNTTSDYRRKSNVKDLTGSGTFIDALKPRTFDWDTGDKGVGFIAHEFSQVSPSSVNGEKDAVDADGKPKYQGMQASSAEVIANLVAELQSLRKRLAALESK